ncbi:MAG TPA: cupin domain-containing protein [Candidatus Acidoferrales bacterium]|nr:cupin domain-containing protein [Candidatus Acidoferrales bacterium]
MPNRRQVLQYAAGLNALAMFAEEGRLANGVVEGSQAKLAREDFGDLRTYYDGPTAQLKSITAGSLRLKPGRSPHPPHEHPEEEFMVVTEGTGEISVEGKVTKVGPGSMMYCAAGKLHGIVNTGSTPLLFYFYKWRA